jgi:hypothetical protein
MRELHVFDFDGTLFDNPCNTPANQKKYEKATGIPWLIDKELSRELSKKHKKHIGMRRGWHGRRETLEPPLVPDPAPKSMFKKEPCEAFLASKADKSVITLFMTGRHGGIRHQVFRIMGDGELLKVKRGVDKEGRLQMDLLDRSICTMFMGDNGPCPETVGPKPTETLPWKLWILEQYLIAFPTVEEVIFWEDREEHAKEFRELDSCLEQKVVVNFVI